MKRYTLVPVYENAGYYINGTWTGNLGQLARKVWHNIYHVLQQRVLSVVPGIRRITRTLRPDSGTLRCHRFCWLHRIQHHLYVNEVSTSQDIGFSYL